VGRRAWCVVVVLIGAMALVTADPARAEPASSLACGPSDDPIEITSDVVLAADVVCDEARWVLAPGVTVDLGGRTITVAQTATCRQTAWVGCNLDVGSGTVRNGWVVGASVRIHDGSFERVILRDGPIAVTLGGAIIESILDGGPVTLASGGTITRSLVVRGSGIELHNTDFPVAGVSITKNVVVDNRGPGIRSFGRVLFDDDISGTIGSNIIIGNDGDGIVFGGQVQSLGSIDIVGNAIVANGGSGIVVAGVVDPAVDFGGGPVTITKNATVFNGGHGIDAPDVPERDLLIVDGGSNRALANGLDPPCIGIAC
jgi:hypothetical protein